MAFTLLASAALAQATTTCMRNGAMTTCNTDPGVGSSSVPNVGQQMLDNMARENQASADRSAMASQSAADRRAAAYAQVGDLIAKGDCVGAKRLAAFYGHKDIVKDTARGCPAK